MTALHCSTEKSLFLRVKPTTAWAIFYDRNDSGTRQRTAHGTPESTSRKLRPSGARNWRLTERPPVVAVLHTTTTCLLYRCIVSRSRDRLRPTRALPTCRRQRMSCVVATCGHGRSLRDGPLGLVDCSLRSLSISSCASVSIFAKGPAQSTSEKAPIMSRVWAKMDDNGIKLQVNTLSGEAAIGSDEGYVPWH